MPLFLGLDCGGTSTRAMVVDEDEKVVFEGRGGPANLATTKESVVLASLASATRAMPRVECAVGCFAGLLGDRGRQVGLRMVSSVAPGVRCQAWPDTVATVYAAPTGTDAVVVSGTGSVVCGLVDGTTVKEGGGGPMLGDFGSAYDVGRRAVHFLLTLSRTEAATERFWDAVEGEFSTRNLEDLPFAVHQVASPASSLAALAPVIGQDCADKHLYAQSAVRGAMASLANQLHHFLLCHCPGDRRRSIALAGGLWSAHEVYQKTFERVFAGCLPGGPRTLPKRQYHVFRQQDPPVLGAARLAKLLFHEH